MIITIENIWSLGKGIGNCILSFFLPLLDNRIVLFFTIQTAKLYNTIQIGALLNFI